MGFQILSQSRKTMQRRVIASCVSLALMSLHGTMVHAAVLDHASQAKAQQVIASVRDQMPNLGAGHALAVRNIGTDARGVSVVHAHQLYQGHRVWGSMAIIHADKSGHAHVASQNLNASAVPSQPATLTQAQATAIALKAMALKGHPASVTADLVVFPTKYHGGLATVWNPQTMQYQLDYKNSVASLVPADPYVWAYDVHIFAENASDFIKDMTYVVNARTGAIMRIQNELRGTTTAPPVNIPTQDPADQPAIGVGHSQYSGTVALNTTLRASDNTYQLIDLTRGSMPNPYLFTVVGMYDPIYLTPFLDANGNPPNAVGLQTVAMTKDLNNFLGFTPEETSYQWYDSNPSNVWGDGNQFSEYPNFGEEMSVNGQTAAVDAHYGMQVTWDFYLNIFGRNGIDDAGNSPITLVHAVGLGGTYGQFAAWSETGFQLLLSDGDKNQNTDPYGNAIPGLSTGVTSMTSVDIVGHELTHSVSNNTAAFNYAGESGGLDEGTADIFSQMIEAYAGRPSGADSTIPTSGNDWLLASKVGPPVRNFAKPSSIGTNPDNWYDGIEFLDTHAIGAPLGRMFYFLSQGASNVQGSTSYSPYLPGGMSGIGNDHAARIWYQALYNYLLPDSGYADARKYAIQAATDLYGAGSVEVTAVKSAFAAINVGGPTDAPRVSIGMPLIHGPNSVFNGANWVDVYGNPITVLEHVPIVEMTTTVKLQASVQNTTNQAVTWQAAGFLGDVNAPSSAIIQGNYGGNISADGSWTPDKFWGIHSISAFSAADPLQYAEGAALVVNGDADGDTEFDAIDLGSVALSWGLNQAARATHSIMNVGYTTSMDVAAIVEAFKNAFGGK